MKTFEKFMNENRLIPKVTDDMVKIIIDDIIDTYDEKRLKYTDGGFEYITNNGSIKVLETSDYNDIFKFFELYINEKRITNVSRYLMKKLYNFFNEKT